MSGHSYSLRALDDETLLLRLSALVSQERESLVDVVEHLAETDRRELAVDHGYPSLFVYCVKALGYSEAEAYLRIRAARAAQRFPGVLEDLHAGAVKLDSIARLYPYLNEDNNAGLLDRAAGATKNEVLALVAELQPQPAPRRDVILPVAATAPPYPEACAPAKNAAGAAPGPQPPPEVIPPPLHRFHFTADRELLFMVERLRGLLRHKHPDGRLEAIFKEAARALLERLDPGRKRAGKAAVKRDESAKPPAKRRRAVPAAVKREVWARDAGRCSYVGPEGLRCGSRDALEYDHIVAWADGGRSDAAENIRLLCRPHNQRLGRRRFGPRRRGGPA